METNETKEDIVREIRDTAEGMKEFNAIQPTRYTIQSWADRLDAAWKREREKYQREYDECARDYNNAQRKRSIAESELADLKKSVGNAAALMVAMKEIRDCAVAGVHSGSVDCYEIIEIAEKAMAAPARNCDMYNDDFDAADAYEKATGVVIHDDPADYYPDYNGCSSLRRRSGKETAMEGNQMKMREALVQCELFLGNVSRHGHPTLCIGDQCTACNGVDELRGMVVRALSAPARNCDLYATAEEALKAQQAAFEESNFENGECKLGCPGCDDFPIKCEVRWLFAPAEKGGEA